MSNLSSDEMINKFDEFQEKCEKYDEELFKQRNFWRAALMFGCEIPYDAYRGTQYHSISQHHFNNESGEWELDVEATQVEIARYVQWAAENGYKVEKKYGEDDFNLYIEVPDVSGRFNIYSTRKVVCKAVVVGKKKVEAVPEHEEDVVEWVCDKIAFLKIDI